MIVHNVKEGEAREEEKMIKAVKHILEIKDPKVRCPEIVLIVTEDYRSWNFMKCHWNEQQLRLTEVAIENNPKSYQAWHHRLYIYRQDPLLLVDKIEREKHLLKLLLDFDRRNFLCWNYKKLITDILKCLIDGKYQMSNDELERLRWAGPIIYANIANEEYQAHEQRIRKIYEEVLDLNNIAKNIDNYSYIHFHGGFDPCAAVFTNPFNCGAWMFLVIKKEEYLLRRGLYVRKYIDRYEVHFREPFSGELLMTVGNSSKRYIVKLPTTIFSIPFYGQDSYSDNYSILINNIHFQPVPVLSPISLNKKYYITSDFNEKLFLSDSLFLEIHKLEPKCLLNSFFNIHFHSVPTETLESLKENDPTRINYYNLILNEIYKIYL